MKKFGPLFVAMAAALWGILGIFVRNLSAAGLSAMEIVYLRVFGSAILLVSVLSVAKRNCLKIKIKDSWVFIGTGIFSIVFFNYCYFQNVQVSSMALAVILMYTSPVWVMLLSRIFFGERFNKKKIIALILAMTGCCLVSGITQGIGAISLKGILFGIGSGFGYGLYSIFGKFALDNGYKPITITTYTFVFACVGVLPFVNIGDIILCMSKNPTLWIWVVCMVLFSTCMSFTLYTIGLSYMDTSRAAVLATLEPIVTTLVGTFLYKEALSFFMVIGIILVLTSSIILSQKH